MATGQGTDHHADQRHAWACNKRSVASNLLVAMATQLPQQVASSSSRRHVRRYVTAACLSSVTATASYYVRQWREEKLQETLVDAASSGHFFCSQCADSIRHADTSAAGTASTAVVAATAAQTHAVVRRDLNELATTVARAGLMKTSKSVKHELEQIRKWHIDHGFNGGLVLRELTEPLFDVSGIDEDDMEGGDDVEPIPHQELLQRECYYLYYELTSRGETKQQIFCRGTTLRADVQTCINAKMKHDEELGCRLHAGFLEHADRLLNDVLPLLAPPSNRRATVEVCGHSLGGAVAFILAMKLKKRGYTVKRATAVAAPRFVEEAAADHLTSLLPKDSLRIEDDCDFVPFLPPHMKGLGDKLWLSSSHSESRDRAYYVPFQSEGAWWLDSFLVNSRLPESFAHIKTVHRIHTHVAKIRALAEEMSQQNVHHETPVATELEDEMMTPENKAIRGSERLQ